MAEGVSLETVARQLERALDRIGAIEGQLAVLIGMASRREAAMMWSRDVALEMERRHVVEAEKRCQRQRDLIGRIRWQDRCTVEAERLLASMEDFLETVRIEVRRLENLPSAPRAQEG
jgi:hypothetical protein